MPVSAATPTTVVRGCPYLRTCARAISTRRAPLLSVGAAIVTLRLRDAAEIARPRPVAAVRQGEVVRRPHLEKPRGRAGELERVRAVRAGKQRLRLRRGGCDELDPHVVQRIDENDEALGLVALGRRKNGDAVDEDRMEALGHFEIIGRAERSSAEAVEIEPGDAADRLRHVQTTAEELDLRRLALPDASEGEESRVERFVGL